MVPCNPEAGLGGTVSVGRGLGEESTSPSKGFWGDGVNLKDGEGVNVSVLELGATLSKEDGMRRRWKAGRRKAGSVSFGRQ